MLVSVLASGSKGNTTLIRTPKSTILIDAGMNYKYIKERLNEFGLSPINIDYIFLTHTHKDHIGALETFIKNNNPIICLGEKMLKELSFLKNYDRLFILKDYIELEDVLVEKINTSHDTSESFGYIFTSNNSSLVYITDTGYLNGKYFNKLSNKSMYIMESNHDPEMLMNGKYPPWLKSRIISDKGHLSNEASSIYLSKIIGNNTKYIVLAHLSHENNTESLAKETIENKFKEYNIKFDNIYIAKQDEKTELFDI